MRSFFIGDDTILHDHSGNEDTAIVRWNGTESYSLAAGAIRLSRAATGSLPADLEGLLAYDQTLGALVFNTGSGWVAGGDDANAIHDNAAAEISAITEKTSPVSGDLLLIEDSAASNAKKRLQIGNLPPDSTAIHDDTASEISAITEKSSPVSADLLLIEDSEAANVKKRIQVGNLPGATQSTGSWTPVLLDTDLDTGEGQTYSTQTGSYIKIGDLVYVYGRMIMSGLGTLSTGAQVFIGGLPFDPDTRSGVCNFALCSNISITANQSLTGYFDMSVSTPIIRVNLWDTATGTSAFLISELTASGDLFFSGCYSTS